MPKTLAVRNIPERAVLHRRSITQEATTIIEEALKKPEKETNVWEEVDALRERVYSRHGSFGDSAPLIREDRERGFYT